MLDHLFELAPGLELRIPWVVKVQVPRDSDELWEPGCLVLRLIDWTFSGEGRNERV